MAPGIQENLGSQENSSQSTSLTQGKEISQTINYEATHIFKNCLEATKKKTPSSCSIEKVKKSNYFVRKDFTFQSYHIIIANMSSFQERVINNTKKKEGIANSQDKLTEFVP